MAEPHMVVVSMPIEDLVPDPENPRKGDVSAIAESLRELGQHRAVVVQKGTNRIIAGNHLTLAASSIGWTHVDVVFVDDDDVKAVRRGIADNATGDRAKWDDDILKGLLGSVGNDVPGLDDKTLARLFKDVATEAPAATHPLVPKPGEHYDYVVFFADNIIDSTFLATLFPDKFQDWRAPKRPPVRSKILPVQALREYLNANGALPDVGDQTA